MQCAKWASLIPSYCIVTKGCLMWYVVFARTILYRDMKLSHWTELMAETMHHRSCRCMPLPTCGWSWHWLRTIQSKCPFVNAYPNFCCDDSSSCVLCTRPPISVHTSILMYWIWTPIIKNNFKNLKFSYSNYTPYGTPSRGFIAVFTGGRYWTMSWARWITRHFFKLHFNITLPYTLRLS